MNIQNFLSGVKQTYKTGSATEHSYRSHLEKLLSSISPTISVLNEPRRVKCGSPDFIISKDGIGVGHVEAKDILVDIRDLKGSNEEQQERYLAALPNLIYTNCLDWDFYREGELVASVTIADFNQGSFNPRPKDIATLENLLQEFVIQRPQTITSPRDLAQRMAGKANLIKDVLSETLREDAKRQGDLIDQSQAVEDNPNHRRTIDGSVGNYTAKTDYHPFEYTEFESDLSGQWRAFKENLIRDISREDFADIYAETIAYGMFAARLNDNNPDTFSRQKALELLPKSNPFLLNLFGYVAGRNLDDRIAWILDDLAYIFRACDMEQIMEGFGRLTGQSDPFLHFYETFLAAYNPAKRKARGVWYTPEPVVRFIVRAVDEVLKSEFGLLDGLTDTSKVTIDWDTGQKATTKSGKLRKDGKNATVKREVHKVQILDPATGTGTFLAEVIKRIASKVKKMAPAMWPQYIERELIPRLHGFELLMASYAMCHIKLHMILRELGYSPSANSRRLSVYLTNSLEEGDQANQTLPFTEWFSREAKEASTIKRDMPIMCVIGNPPYLSRGGVSTGWLGDLMKDYKKEPGGLINLHEPNPKWLNDLYVKFIRLSSHFIERNREGVLGFITNHGYLDNPTFRGMRWHLLKTFDRIWVIDLHGNANRREVSPDGRSDKNVFDIRQGVAIIIAVKTGKRKSKLGEVFRGDLWGDRETKYNTLSDEEGIRLANLERIETRQPHFFFKHWDFKTDEQFRSGFSLGELMPINSIGIVTGRDTVLIASDRDTLRNQVMHNYGEYDEDFVQHLSHRPFQTRYLYNDPEKVERGREEVMRHYNHKSQSNEKAKKNQKPQIGLLMSKQIRDENYAHVFVTEFPSKADFLSGTSSTNAMNAPLYIYPSDQYFNGDCRINFDDSIYTKLQNIANHPDYGIPEEYHVFDYIYGVLHCPAYRKKFAECLKIYYPHIPWPSTPDEFWELSAKGSELRKLHLMEPDSIGETPYQFNVKGDNIVTRPRFKNGHVWINDTQFFAEAPLVSWTFYIGGYQPAQKWLKDRRGTTLCFEDVKHYQRILKVLSKTDRIMQTIKMDFTSNSDG